MTHRTIISAVLAAALFLLSACGEEKEPSSGGGGFIPPQTSFNVPSLNEMAVYEACPRLFAASGSLNAIRARLDRISALGVNVLWIMPIFTGSAVRKPKGSPYSMKDFMSIDPEYGTVDDLKALVKDAHARGIAVILDFITNHTGADCQWVTDHPDWYMEAYSPTYTDAALFDWRSQELRSEIIRIMKYWIVTADIDGYRCDSASPTRENGVSLDFWRQACSSLRASFPSRKLILLAESAKADVLSAGFDMNYGWHYCEELMGLFSGSATPSDLYSINASESSVPEGKARMRYSTNHDRNAQEDEFPGLVYGGADAQMAAFALVATMGGVPMIYSSQEVAYDKRISFFKGNSPIIDWTSGTDLTQRYRELVDLSKTEVMRKGAINQIPNDNIISFIRTFGSSQTLVLVNFRGTDSKFTIPDNYSTKFGLTRNTLSPYEYIIIQK